MLFHILQYLSFLPAAVIVYYCLPQKVRYIWLLFCVHFLLGILGFFKYFQF